MGLGGEPVGERMVIAFCGKGGVGKTSLSALAVRLMLEGGRRVLAVDADPSMGLSLALGLRPRRTLDHLRREMVEALRGKPQDRVDLAASLDYKLLEILEERGCLAFLAVGRPEEEGCYCRLNSFLREAIEALSYRFQVVVIDAEAGLEQVNRRVMRSVTHLALVSDASAKGIRVAEDLAELALRAVSPEKMGLVFNRLAGKEVFQVLSSRTHLPVLGWVPEEPEIARYDREALSLLDMPANPALQALEECILGSGFLETGEADACSPQGTGGWAPETTL